MNSKLTAPAITTEPRGTSTGVHMYNDAGGKPRKTKGYWYIIILVVYKYKSIFRLDVEVKG